MTNISWWSDQRKVDVVKTFLITGSVKEAASVNGVPYDTVRHWRLTDWWKEIEDNLRAEENLELSAHLQKRIGKALALMDDRMENGDFMYDPRTGNCTRKPVSMRDLNKAVDTFIKAKIDVDSVPRQAQSAQGIADALAKISEHFKTLTTAKQPDKAPENGNETKLP